MNRNPTRAFFVGLICFATCAFSAETNAPLTSETIPLSAQTSKVETVATKKKEPAKTASKKTTTKKLPEKAVSKHIQKIKPSEIKHFLDERSPFEGSEKDRYVVNYNNVDVKEVLRFIGKVASLNFTYDPAQLNFGVTMVSEGPAHISDILATLVQTLSIHGLSLVVNDGMVTIAETGKINGAAPLVKSYKELGDFAKSPLAARAFYLENIQPSDALTLVKPMLSPNAISEASDASNYLILTDTPANLSELEKYVHLLDHPHEQYEISIFHAQYNYAASLATLAETIMSQAAGKTPLKILPQKNANSILIISTPFLVEKTLAVLQKLDVKVAPNEAMPKNISHENVFVYTPKFMGAQQLMSALGSIKTSVKAAGFNNQDLTQTIQSMRWISETGSLVFIGDTQSIAKLKEVLTTLDIDTKSLGSAPGFLVYTPKFLSYSELKVALAHVASTLAASKQGDQSVVDSIHSAKYSPASGTMTFVGSHESLEKIKQVLSEVDNKDSSTRIERQFFLYRPENATPKTILSSLKEVSADLKKSKILDADLIEAVAQAKLVPDSDGVLFIGNEKTLAEVRALLKNIDKKGPGEGKISSFGGKPYLLYSIRFMSEPNLICALDQIASKLEDVSHPDDDLIRSLKHVKYIRQTHSLMFGGDASTLNEISSMLIKLDTQENAKDQATEHLTYRPHYLDGKELLKELKHLEDSLKDSGLHNPALLSALQNAVWSEKSHALIISGSKEVLEDVQHMLKTVDVPNAGLNHTQFIYKVEHVAPIELLHNLRESAEQLKGEGERSVMDVIDSAKIFKNTTTISFSGSKYGIEKVKEMLKNLDVESTYSKGGSVFIYHPKYMSHANIEKSLKKVSERLDKEGSGQDLSYLIDSREWNAHANSYVFTGSTAAIEKLKSVLTQIDQPSSSSQSVEVYTLQHINGKEAQNYLKELEKNLKSTEADKNIQFVLEHAKIVPGSHSVVLKGKPDAIAHVKELLVQYDSEKNSANPNSKNVDFYTYHPKYVSGQDLVEHLHKMGEDLERSGLVDHTMLLTLKNARFNAKAENLIVTGSAESIKRAKEMIQKLDVPGKGAGDKSNSTFLIYTPEYVTAQQLEDWLKNAQQNLKKTGLNDDGLFKVLESMHKTENGKSLMFSGSKDGLDRLKELIRNYDNASKGSIAGQHGMNSANGLTFLIYKLQYHQGAEIMNALQSIGEQMKKFEKQDQATVPSTKTSADKDHEFEAAGASSSSVDQSLINAIASMQWLKMTNSILCSGTSASLEKIKDLIRKLDIPLRQVFLEVLIINTSLTESLSFGVRWGGAGTIHNRLSTSLGLFPTVNDIGFQQNGNLNSFGNNVQTSVPTSSSSATPTAPSPNSIFGNPGGFDFGVIGDIISHGSNVYLSLGSLASALQTDRNSTVILNPKIIAQDNQPAHMFSGQNRPFSVSIFTQTSTGGASTDTTSTNDYRDVGFDLKITPILGANDVITLIIEQDFSEQDLPSGIDSDATVQNNTVSKQTTQTRVHVPNEHFVAISGMLRDTRARGRVGIPCLGGLPVIGAAFAQNQKTNQKTNTIIFIRPQIVTTDEQMVTMTERQEDVFREQAKALELQYDIDDAIDMMVPIDELD
jgi:type II secretory pathway component GspD/PulD (secretin)